MVRAIIHKQSFSEVELTLFSDGTSIVFSYAEDKVIKIFPPFHQSQFDSERLVLKHLDGNLSIRTPTLEHEGEIFGWSYLIMSKLEGTNLETLWETMSYNNKVVILRELGALIQEVHALPTDGLEVIDCHWPHFLEKQIANGVEQHRTNWHGIISLLA